MSWLAPADQPHECVMPAQLGRHTDGAIWRCDACGVCWRLNLPITRDPRAASWTRLPGVPAPAASPDYGDPARA